MRFQLLAATAAVLLAPTVLAQQIMEQDGTGHVFVGAPGNAPPANSPPANSPPAQKPSPPAPPPAPVPAPPAPASPAAVVSTVAPVAAAATTAAVPTTKAHHKGDPSAHSAAVTPAPAATTKPHGSGKGGSDHSSNGPNIDGGHGAMTWNIINKEGKHLSMIYEHNAGGVAPVGNPTDTTIASSTQVVFPSGWAGRITIGPTHDTAGSKIEGSVMPQFNIDVSYVDGFTVPITCADHGTGETITGCNIPLFKQGIKCPKQGPGPICYNTEVALTKFSGPADPFFAACAGAAYTFPKDDLADVVSSSPIIDCCIGESCPAPKRQKSKGVPNAVARRWAYSRNVFDY